MDNATKFDVENLDTKLDRSPIVYIGNKSGHDFSASEKYGTPVYVTKGELNRFEVNWMARKWMKALLSSNAEDMILITSLTNLTCIGCAIFGWLHGRINILMFRNDKYVKRSIVFAELKEAEKEALNERQ